MSISRERERYQACAVWRKKGVKVSLSQCLEMTFIVFLLGGCWRWVDTGPTKV
jgi:hypothetical protein